jgi:hypothetical protein
VRFIPPTDLHSEEYIQLLFTKPHIPLCGRLYFGLELRHAERDGISSYSTTSSQCCGSYFHVFCRSDQVRLTVVYCYFFLKFKKPNDTVIKTRYCLPETMGQKLVELKESTESPEGRMWQCVSF